jgi:hypothetical protein
MGFAHRRMHVRFCTLPAISESRQTLQPTSIMFEPSDSAGLATSGDSRQVPSI